MKSFRGVLSSFMALSFVCLLLCMLWSNGIHYHQLMQNRKNSNQQIARLWSSTIDTHLAAVDSCIDELKVTLYNNTELKSGSLPMRYEARRRCLEAINEKQLANSDLTYVYIFDQDSDMLLFCSRGGIPDQQVVSAKAYLKENCRTIVTQSSGRWHALQINGSGYFLKAVTLGKYGICVLSLLDNYNYPAYAAIDGAENADYACLLQNGDSLFSLGNVGLDCTAADLSPENGALTLPKHTICSSNELQKLPDTKLLLITPTASFSEIQNSSVAVLTFAGVLCLILALVQIYLTKRMLIQPVGVILKANEHIMQGDLEYRIQEKAQSSEFEALYHSFNEMSGQIRTLKVAAYEQQLQRQQEELNMLRSQIRPHFYLNALTTISNMTYGGNGEEIRSYLQMLSKYIRYMLKIRDKTIPLRQELAHIENYTHMQQAKYPGSVDIFIGCPDSVGSVPIPYLVLFTVVENAFKHAMTCYQPLRVIIQCESVESKDFSGIRISVEDNGGGFPEAVLESFQSGVQETEQSAHFGLRNVQRTLELTYGRKGLLRLKNAPQGGAHAELWIPETPSSEKKAFF